MIASRYSYKVQIAGICQDLNQLKALYKERWESFLANAGVVQGFTPNDLTTADWMSRRAGQATMLAPSSSESRSPGSRRSAGKNICNGLQSSAHGLAIIGGSGSR